MAQRKEAWNVSPDPRAISDMVQTLKAHIRKRDLDGFAFGCRKAIFHVDGSEISVDS